MSHRPAYRADVLQRIRAREERRREYEARLIDCLDCRARFDPTLFETCPWCLAQTGPVDQPDGAA
jgi:hypothetical protein